MPAVRLVDIKTWPELLGIFFGYLDLYFVCPSSSDISMLLHVARLLPFAWEAD